MDLVYLFAVYVVAIFLTINCKKMYCCYNLSVKEVSFLKVMFRMSVKSASLHIYISQQCALQEDNSKHSITKNIFIDLLHVETGMC